MTEQQQVWTGSGFKTTQNDQQQQTGNGEQAGEQTGSAVQQQQEQQQERQYSEIELVAMKMGWNPEHDPSSGREFKSAEQFILDGKEYQDTTVKSLKTLQRQNEELAEGMRHLRETHKRSLAAEKRRVDDEIGKLKAQRDQAIENADKDQVNQIDTQIQTLENDKREMEQAGQQQQSTAGGDVDFKTAAKQWQEQNPWYGTDQVMSDFIDAQSERFRGLPPEMYFERLTQTAKATFPEKFQQQQTNQQSQQQTNQQSQQQTVVGGQTRQTGAGPKTTFTYEDLSPEQKRMAQQYERLGVMKKQEYVEEQAKIGNIPGQMQQ